MGTPAYMAPEQARGEVIDARADVYSLGAMLYELLAGEPPHTGDSADQILVSALTSVPVAIEERQPGAPPDLVAIVHKAMAPRPVDRYPSATPLAEDIRRFQTGQLVTARQYSTRTLARRWIARHRGVVAVAAAAAVALAATGAVGFQRVVAQRNVAEARRAEAQRAVQTVSDKRTDLIFLQAQSWLARDPTSALAWLKRYPQEGHRADRLGAMVDEALEMGVARHVLRQPTWVMGVGFTGDSLAVVGVLKSGEVMRWDVATGAGRLIGRHSETVKIADLSPDGRLLAVGGTGGAVALFSLDGDAPARRLRGHVDEIRWLSFSADGRRLLTGSADRAIRLWDLGSEGPPLLTIDREPVASVALAADGQSVFIGLSSGEVARINVATHARRKLARLGGPAGSLAPSPDGRYLAAQRAEGAIALVDPASGAVTELELRGGKGSWGFSPSSRFLTAAGPDGTIRLHEMATGSEKVLRGHEDSVYNLVFSPDESVLLSASDDATARVWDLRTDGVRILRGHDDDVWQAALSRDGKLAATASLDASIRLWEMGGSEGLIEVVGRIGRVAPERWSALTRDAGVVVSWPEEEEVETWHLASGQRRSASFQPVDRLNPRFRHTYGKVLERRAGLLAVPQPGGSVVIWDVLSGERRQLGGDEGPEVTALGLSSDGHTMVTADADGLVRVWDLAHREQGEPRVLLHGRRRTRGAAVSRSGDRLALALDGRLDLFDMTSGERLASAQVDAARAASDQPCYLEFSPDGRFLASRSKASSSLVLWNLDSGQAPQLDIGGHEVVGLAFSPDSSRLALAVADRTVRVVDTTSRQARLLQGHRDLVNAVVWSPDGAVLASASYDRTIRLWDPGNGRVRVLRGHGGSVQSVAFSPDGTRLTSASTDGTVRRWHLDRLPEDRAEVVTRRLEAATTAVIGAGAGERAATLTAAQEAAAASGPAPMAGAAHSPAAGWAPAR
jgi:WD40 repeat protein